MKIEGEGKFSFRENPDGKKRQWREMEASSLLLDLQVCSPALLLPIYFGQIFAFPARNARLFRQEGEEILSRES